MRRDILAVAIWVGFAVASSAVPARATDPQAAVAFIQQAGAELGQLIATTPDPAARRQRIGPFLDRTVDIEGVARFCAGRFWRTATPDQQREYVALFRDTLANGVGDRLGAYTGGPTQVITQRPEVRPDGVLVPTVLQPSSGNAVRVAWVVESVGGTLKIADVIAEGISLRQTQRSDQTAFLSRNNGDLGTLITALRNQQRGRS